MKYSIMGKKNKGFTLVEMMVVILVMSIMLGATMWGVTGWIHHFTYIKSEETARYIYMGAQSGLSAYSARGTLDELFDSIRKQSESGSADVIVVDPGDKEGFGLPINPDNRNKDHEYAYLKVPKGGLDQNPLLYSLVKPYLSDKESLDGSMVVELDMTSRKVYSTFYSPWAAGFSYGSANYPAAIKGTFPIFKQSIGGADVDTRAESERTECCIGYYASDQINVSDLKMTKNLDIDYLHLYNDETLHLDFRSDADQENNTTYDITIQSVANNGTVTDEFTVVFDPSVALGTFDDTTTYTPWKTSLPIKDSVLGADATCDFYVGYQKSLQEGLEDDDEIRDLVLILDTQGIGQVHGLAAKESAEGYSDKSTMSITSLLGDDPKNIRAVVSVYPNASGMAYYSVTPGTKESNVENDLFATDLSDENNPGSDPVINPGEYSIANTRHLSNIRYYERRKENGLAGGPATYTLKRDIYWNNAQVYDCADHVYLKSGAVEAFATIPYLSQDSMLDGAGRAIYDLNLNNSSYVVYPRLANGRVDEDDKNNQADMIGMIAKNSGTVKGLVLRGAKAEYLTSAQANIDQASADKNRIYSDKIQAAGIICGRDMGSMQEIYLDDACSLKAAIFQADTPDRTVGCGIGMLAGTVNLEKAATAQVHDRLRTGGTLTATLDSRFDKVAYAAEEYPGRNLVYEGANADAHDYGVGGMFGYVYGDYTATGNGLKQPVVGLMEDEVIAKAGAGGYMTAPVDLRQPDETNKKTDAQRTNDQTDVFKDWKWSLENRCVVNDENTAANMEFVGGILGNIQVDLPGAIAHKQDDEDDWTIPDGLVENIAGCRNYGAVTGADLVGGITGINGPTVYIADCVSYSDMKAVNGVAAGIAAENYGYIKNCRVERAAGDEVRPDGYFPLLDGNETVAGAVTSVNYHQAVIMDCAVSSPEEEKELALNQGTIPGDDDIIKIKGNEMDTIGYLAGINYGTIDGGTIGSFVGYQSDKENMVIGGVAGINHTDGVIKHIESSIDFDTSDAKFVGGIAGRNSGDIRSCIFSGKITQPARERSVAGICYGGIAAINTKDKDFAIKQIPLITNCYLVGFSIDAKGYGNYLAENTESQMIDRCSAIGGVCGTNDIESKITDCYATAHYMLDDSGDALKDALNKDIIKEQSKLTVKNGLVGGITGLNKGDLIHCGYSDKVILLQSDLDEAGSQAAIKYASKITRKDDRKLLSALCQAQLSDAETSSMQLADTVAHYLETAVQQQTYPADSDSFIGTNAWTAGRNAAIAEIRTALANGGYEENEAEIRTMAAEKLRLSLMDDGRGELKNSVAKY
ncbi:MAG: prepilin-type N-terminal cleavage/methylation domain-containing protein, partial [Lachnospiraceae bacterium]|nr:prepilin-type N-terminal cleavage/methylation domain-containing protein [Lachnospiraceae bacterium]